MIRYNFVRLRQERNLTQEKLAEMADKDKSYIGNIETGKFPFSLRSQLFFANLFGVDRSAFYKPIVTNEPTICQQIAELCKDMPEQWQNEVLDYIRYIRTHKMNPSGGNQNDDIEKTTFGRRQ